ncbi:hypothetical protein LIER_39089 [Lithospermum erythrorhizon]|uniref:Uncharacterized protein n=1 Tax=Lithospermum erythrorhizon TaxID=34254 RepID=A0AAV3QA63_LITER
MPRPALNSGGVGPIGGSSILSRPRPIGVNRAGVTASGTFSFGFAGADFCIYSMYAAGGLRSYSCESNTSRKKRPYMEERATEPEEKAPLTYDHLKEEFIFVALFGKLPEFRNLEQMSKKLTLGRFPEVFIDGISWIDWEGQKYHVK